MITVNIREEDEFIKLGQALKKSRSCWFRCWSQNGYFRWADFGKRLRQNFNEEKKLHNGDVVTFQGETIQIVQ